MFDGNARETVGRELATAGLDGWLLYDFRGTNPFAARVLGLQGAMLTRRWFFWLPTEGAPVLLVHAIERGSIPDLPGVEMRAYADRRSLVEGLRGVLGGARTVAMEYSEGANNPYISKVDAGTVDLVRSFGVDVVGSGDLLQSFVTWSDANLRSHRRAAAALAAAKDDALGFIEEGLARRKSVGEGEVQALIAELLAAAGMVYDHPPIVAFGQKTSDPHYAVGASGPRALGSGEPILMDLWCREAGPDGAYADIAWMAHAGEPDEAFSEVFAVVLAARDEGIRAIRDAAEGGRILRGWQVDRAVRELIEEAGYGRGVLHRTGHSLGTDAPHGDAVNLDDFETRDERGLVAGVAVTVEPGVYLERFGARSEVDVFVGPGSAEVTTVLQQRLDVLGA